MPGLNSQRSRQLRNESDCPPVCRQNLVKVENHAVHGELLICAGFRHNYLRLLFLPPCQDARSHHLFLSMLWLQSTDTGRHAVCGRQSRETGSYYILLSPERTEGIPRSLNDRRSVTAGLQERNCTQMQNCCSLDLIRNRISLEVVLAAGKGLLNSLPQSFNPDCIGHLRSGSNGLPGSGSEFHFPAVPVAGRIYGSVLSRVCLCPCLCPRALDDT